MPVTSVALVRDSVKCSALGAGWVDVNSHLATWPGTVDGCHENGKLRVGKCHNGKGTNVEGVDAISKDVRMW